MRDGGLMDIDVGVRSLVWWLNAEGFCTTDSGDGVSKAEAIDAGEALSYPHVFIAVDPRELIDESVRLLRVLSLRGIELQEMGTTGPCVQASYDPVSGAAILMLLHVDDLVLGGHQRS